MVHLLSEIKKSVRKPRELKILQLTLEQLRKIFIKYSNLTTDIAKIIKMIAIIHALAYTEAAANTMKIFLRVIKY